MIYNPRRKTIQEEAEDENLRAVVANQQEELVKTKLLLQYVADMTDVYIPEDDTEETEGVADE